MLCSAVERTFTSQEPAPVQQMKAVLCLSPREWYQTTQQHITEYSILLFPEPETSHEEYTTKTEMNNHLCYKLCIYLVSECLQFVTVMLQVLATSAKNILLLGYGMTLGFPTIVIPSLQPHHGNVTDSREKDMLTLSEEQISWFSK